MVMWFDADESYITKDGSDFISQWDDKSGNDHHLLQAVEVRRPSWYAVAQNGLPAVSFGTVDSRQQMSVGGFAFDQPGTYYFVLKIVNWGLNESIMDGNTLNSQTAILKGGAGAPTIRLNAGNPADEVALHPIGTYGIVMFIFNTDSSVVKVNNIAATTGLQAGGNDPEGFALAHRPDTVYRCDMDVCEILVYNAAHDSDDWGQTFAYLNAKYSIY